jgi:very-short-patch-repair endonuclease
MPEKSLITQQHVSSEMHERSKELRREMTPAESKLWQELRGGRMEGFHFRRQQIVGHYIVDFYCHRVALVVEVDGDVHFHQQGYDRQRDRDLEDLGLRVLHFWNSDVNENMEEVLEKILLACRPTPTPPPAPEWG